MIIDHKDLIWFLNAIGRDRCTIIAIDGKNVKIAVDDHRKPCDNTITNTATGVTQMAFNTGERETVYKEFSSARWNFWTYIDGIRYSISERQFSTMERQGAKVVIVK